MALISCPECNQPVSDTAVMCPHCGFNIEALTAELRVKDEILKLAESVKMPNFPLWELCSIADILITGITIGTILAFNPFAYSSVRIIGLIVIGIIQVFFLPQIIKKIRTYRFAKKNFEEYQVKTVIEDINNYSKKKSFGIYLLSFLIPIIGFILGLKSDPEDGSYDSSTCLILSIISFILNFVVVLIGQLQ